ncbi:hypothetical protein VTO42DRAFT_4402 [Malbranchea cinnamomea]
MGSDPAATPSSSDAKALSVLFVCLGNICRSPMAEAVFRHYAASSTLSFSKIDSAGTGAYHLHSPPDSRTVSTLKSHSITCRHSARQVNKGDFTDFDYILAMDEENLEDLLELREKVLKRLGPNEADRVAEVRLFGDYKADGSVCDKVGGGEVVPDPYYGGKSGFEDVYRQLTRFTTGFLKYLEKKYSDVKD